MSVADEGLLRAAFEAGFYHAGEGHNGEYVGKRYREPGALDADLNEGFDEWWTALDAAVNRARDKALAELADGAYFNPDTNP